MLLYSRWGVYSSYSRITNTVLEATPNGPLIELRGSFNQSLSAAVEGLACRENRFRIMRQTQVWCVGGGGEGGWYTTSPTVPAISILYLETRCYRCWTQRSIVNETFASETSGGWMMAKSFFLLTDDRANHTHSAVLKYWHVSVGTRLKYDTGSREGCSIALY